MLAACGSPQRPAGESDRAAVDVDAPTSDAKRPDEWHFVQRTWPHFDFDRSAVTDALAKRRQMAAASKSVVPWVLAGPTNIGGRIVDVEFDPKTPSTIYAGAATGGVFKSTDGGETWSAVFDDQAVLSVGDIGVDPVNPETLFVGTGEANGQHNNVAGAGMYRSTDGGATWEYVGLAETTSIGRVVVERSKLDRILVAAIGSYFAPDEHRGVYVSDDNAGTWSKTLHVNDSTGVIDIAVNPRDPDTVFAASWERVRRPSGPVFLHGNGSGIWRSVDGGDTWQRLTTGLPRPDDHRDATGRAEFGRIGLAISQSHPQTVYALYTEATEGGYLGLYRTDDGGESWYDADPAHGANNAFRNFSWYMGQVRVHPENRDHVFVMDVDLAVSVNGGDSWSIMTGTHVDHHTMAFEPGGHAILEGNDGGLAVSQNGGTSWARVGQLPITQFYEINYDPSDPTRLFGGTQDNGTLRSDGAGGSWEQFLGGDGFYVAVDPRNPSRIYAESQNGDLYRFESGTQTYIRPSGVLGSNWSTPFLIDPHNPDLLYYGGRRIFRSENRGNSWTAISDALGAQSTGRLGTITSISVSPLDPDIIYAGTDDGKVWMTDDRGESWLDRSTGLVRRWVTRVVADEYDPATVYVTFSGLKWRDPEPHIFRSTNRGTTWTAISAGLPDAPVNAFAVDSDRPGYLYAGTDVGAFYSVDNGVSWALLGTGLPAVPVYDLKYAAETETLLAGTHGRSIYALDLSGGVTNVDDAVPETEIALLAYPNPFRESVRIEVNGADAGRATAAVYDIDGRLVTRLAGVAVDGAISFDWDGASDAGIDVASGRYVVVLESGADGDTIPSVASIVIVRAR